MKVSELQSTGSTTSSWFCVLLKIWFWTMTQTCGALQSSSVIGAAAAAARKKVATGSPDGADGLRAVSSYVDNLRRASRVRMLWSKRSLCLRFHAALVLSVPLLATQLVGSTAGAVVLHCYTRLLHMGLRPFSCCRPPASTCAQRTPGTYSTP
jgi:hypothetical protein